MSFNTPFPQLAEALTAARTAAGLADGAFEVLAPGATVTV